MLKKHMVHGFNILMPDTKKFDSRASGEFEKGILECEKLYLREGMSCVDVGGGIGYNCLHMGACVGNKGRVYVFEPDIERFNLLVKNIIINGYSQVIPINKMCSDFHGCTSFTENKLLGINDSVFPQENLVETIRLDDFIKGKIDYLKIDVEGGEYRVLLGAKKILKYNPYIMLETHEKQSKGEHQFAIEFLKKRGYRMTNTKTGEILEEINTEQLLSVQRWWCNPPERN